MRGCIEKMQVLPILQLSKASDVSELFTQKLSCPEASYQVVSNNSNYT